MKGRALKVGLLAALVTPFFAASLSAQQMSPEEEMARKAADPLGDVRALMTDNTIVQYFFN